jgi:CBS domain containing-hemolysin-like protein
LVPIAVYVALAVSAAVSFWSSLIEATFLTLRPLSLTSSISNGSHRATKASGIVGEKTKLVSVTTLVDTMSNVVLASSIGLILSDYFGPIGWVYSAVVGSFIIMTFLYLLPKAIGIENALRMSLFLAPSTSAVMTALSPVAQPLTSIARSLSERLVGKGTYKQVDLAAEFEDVVMMLEKGGHIEPDAGRLLRTALASSRSTAMDSLTPTKDIVYVESGATILEALRAMGEANHPRMPVYDKRRREFLGAVTFRTLSKAISRDLLDENVTSYMIQPARVSRDDGIGTVIEKMQDAAATVAFVYSEDEMIGLITLSDIIEQVMGVRV